MVADEAAHAVVDGASLFHGRDDRREVVVEEDEVSCFLGEVGAARNSFASRSFCSGSMRAKTTWLGTERYRR